MIETRVGLQAATVEELARHAACIAAGTRAIHLTPVRRGMIAQVTSRPTAAQHLRDLARLQASGAEVVQEPTEQPYGVRDCAFRDPAGNMVRIQELR